MQDGRCPECGRAVSDSLLSADEARIVARENRILARADRYRRNRSAAGCLSGISVMGTAIVFIAGALAPSVAHHPALIASMMSGFAAGWFWAAIAYANHCRYDHARSIERFRRHRAERSDTDVREGIASDPPSECG